MKKDIVLVSGHGGDWEGVYVDGELKYEDHSLQPSELLDVLCIKHEYKSIDEEFFISSNGRLPKCLKDCEFEEE